MAYSITFQQRGSLLAKYEYDAGGADDLKALIEQAHDQFRKDFPNISLFNGVTVLYDKSSVGNDKGVISDGGSDPRARHQGRRRQARGGPGRTT